MKHKTQPLFSPDDTGDHWSEIAQKADPQRDAYIAFYDRPILTLQDNRCPICLGDLYACECGKVRR